MFNWLKKRSTISHAKKLCSVEEEQEAIVVLTELLREHPLDSEILLTRGNIYLSLKNFKSALIDFDEVINNGVNTAQSLCGRAYAYLGLNRFTEAFKDSSLAVARFPGSAEAWRARGLAHLAVGNNQCAVDDFTSYMGFDSQNPEGHHCLAKAWLKLERPTLAAREALMATELNSNITEYQCTLAQAYLARGNYDYAKTAARNAIQLDPRHAESWAALGEACYRLQQMDESKMAFKTALDRDPNITSPFTWLIELVDHHEIDQLMQDWINRDSKDPKAYFEGGRFFSDRGAYERALEFYNEAVTLLPNDFEVFAERGMTYRWLNQDSKAREDFQTFAALHQPLLTDMENKHAVEVTAELVQANNLLFGEGCQNLPCLVLICFEISTDEIRNKLQELARLLIRFKNTEGKTPEEEHLIALTYELWDEYERKRVPSSVCDGFVIYVCQLTILRPYLPDGYLSGNRRLRCLAEPGEQGRIELLPQPGVRF